MAKHLISSRLSNTTLELEVHK